MRKDFYKYQECDKYVLTMFMYTSGKVHMGHIRSFSICDLIGNFWTIMGYKVFQPMAWDSFGLPAENAAKLQNIAPRTWTVNNIAVMKEQIIKFDFSFCWNTEYSTCDHTYYRWDQQIFCDLWNAGLIYEGERLMPFCALCDTVLAREQSTNDKCWRCDSEVIYKNTKQMFIKTSAMAEKLHQDLRFFKCSQRFLESQQAWLGTIKKQYNVIVDDVSLGYIFVSRNEIKKGFKIAGVDLGKTIYLRSISESEDTIWSISNKDCVDVVHCQNQDLTKNSIFECRLEDWCVSRQRQWGSPIPVVVCKECGMYAWYSDEFSLENQQQANILCFKCGNNASKYNGTLDTLYTSSWHMYRYTDYDNDKVAFNKITSNSFVNYYIGGMEHATGHYMYARFMHKFFLSQRLVNSVEAFDNIITQALVLGETYQCDGCSKYFAIPTDTCTGCNLPVKISYQKMSKSKGNGVDPVELLTRYNADTIKLHLLYLAPTGKDILWSENGISGMERLLNKIIDMCNKRSINAKTPCLCEHNLYVYHYNQLIQMRDYIETTIANNNCSFNVAMRSLFTTITYLKQLSMCECGRFECIVRMYILMLYIYAPSTATQCYLKLFGEDISYRTTFSIASEIVRQYKHEKPIKFDSTIASLYPALSIYSINDEEFKYEPSERYTCKYNCEVIKE